MKQEDVVLGQVVRVQYGKQSITCKVYKKIEQTNEWGLRKVRHKSDEDYYHPRVHGVCDYFASADKLVLVTLARIQRPAQIDHRDPTVVWGAPQLGKGD